MTVLVPQTPADWQSVREIVSAAGDDRAMARADGAILELASLPWRTSHLHEHGPLTYQWALYVLVRALRPHHLVETGVYHGVSTALMLEALRKNHGEMAERGYLWSADPRYGSQGAAEAAILAVLGGKIDFSAWRFFGGRGVEMIHNLYPRTGVGFAVDLFVHDSDHSPGNVRAELSAIWPLLPSAAVVCIDDAGAPEVAAELARLPVRWAPVSTAMLAVKR